ncbi:MAG: ribosomal protein S18-alanine N-acetyltransferase [Gemmatimonadales bacterium]
MSAPPADVTIRPAVKADLDAIHAIERESFGDPWSHETFRNLLDRAPGTMEVAVGAAGALIGYAVAWYAADEAEIANIAVAPNARRKGVGALLLDRLLQSAATFGARTVFLEVRESNLEARKLYDARGFGIVGRRKQYYRQPDEDALIMRLGL